MTKNNKLYFGEDRIFLNDCPNINIMMEWERELMKAHASILPNGDVLEIGFGMGISAQYIQNLGVKSHTICEVNTQILERLIAWSKDKPNVNIVVGDWIETLPELNKKFDGIWYDADCSNIFKVNNVIQPLLKKNGVFTYFDPKGLDRYNLGNKLIVDEIMITCDIPENTYHNDKLCKVPYYINK